MPAYQDSMPAYQDLPIVKDVCVIPSPDKPKMEEVIDPIREETPDLYPSCAVTRAMTQKAKLSKFLISNSVSSEYDLASVDFVVW